MEEVIIKFLDIATIKFIGTPELIELVKKYYPGLENKKAKENYTIKLNTRILPTDLKIPQMQAFKDVLQVHIIIHGKMENII